VVLSLHKMSCSSLYIFNYAPYGRNASYKRHGSVFLLIYNCFCTMGQIRGSDDVRFEPRVNKVHIWVVRFKMKFPAGTHSTKSNRREVLDFGDWNMRLDRYNVLPVMRSFVYFVRRTHKDLKGSWPMCTKFQNGLSKDRPLLKVTFKMSLVWNLMWQCCVMVPAHLCFSASLNIQLRVYEQWVSLYRRRKFLTWRLCGLH
jgi:hypothetical protein